MDVLTGYRRQAGRWGVRNHVLVLPVRAAAATAARAAASKLTGAVSIAHDWDGSPADPDRRLILRTLAGTAANPNVAHAVIIGVDRRDAEVPALAEELGASIDYLTLARSGGTTAAARTARQLAKRAVAWAARLPREPMPISALSIGLECGGSDSFSGLTANPALGVASDRLVAGGATTVLAEIPELVGAEHLLAQRAISPEVGDQVLALIARWEKSLRELGVDIRGAQPTPGNIRGGLSTIEEKSLGAAKKAGDAPVVGVLEFAERPRRPGLHIMDTPGHDIESVVGLTAGGCQLVAFTTGRGSPTGSPIAPVLKIATNTATYRRLADDIDLNAGTVLDGGETISSMGARIEARLIAAAAGALTSAERRGNREFALRREAYRDTVPLDPLL